jgi:hypothetical protein
VDQAWGRRIEQSGADSTRSAAGDELVKKRRKGLDLQPGFGALAWLVERYKRSHAWEGFEALNTNTCGRSTS